MIRLQQPYNLKEIAEVQQYLNYVLNPARITADADVLHRRRCASKTRFIFFSLTSRAVAVL
jgi:hypothetical protein